MTLGKRLRAARGRLNPKPTQTEIDAHFGVTDKAVSAWERDDTVPEFDKLGKLARLLKVPCNWLVEGTGEPPPPDALEVQIEQLSPSDRALVDAMIRTIRKERGKVA